MRDVTGDREWRGGRRKGEEEPALQIKNRSRAPDYIATTINIVTTGNDKARHIRIRMYVCMYGLVLPIWKDQTEVVCFFNSWPVKPRKSLHFSALRDGDAVT